MKETFLLEFGEKIKLDKKDKKIIELLQRNARISISEIARKTGIPRDSIKYRIRRLERQKVIRFYHAFLNPSKLGYPMYSYVAFTMHNMTEEKEKKFISFLNAHKNVIYVSKTSGNWDFAIGICSKNFKEFDDILRNIRLKFSNIIKEHQVSSVIQEYKYDWMVDLI